MNPDAFEDLLIDRGKSRSEVAEETKIALSTLSGMARTVEPAGASLKVAVQLAKSLRCRVGTLFPELIGRAANVDGDDAELAESAVAS